MIILFSRSQHGYTFPFFYKNNVKEVEAMNNRLTEAYISILKEELLMATGCTEPIAIAYCAAKMRDILGGEPERIEAEVSGNILKNVKSVIVPNTGGLKGINAAIAAGIIAGRAEKVLQVISYVTQEVTAA